MRRREEGWRVTVPRKGPAVHRGITPDPVYQNPLVTQLVNKVLLHKLHEQVRDEQGNTIKDNNIGLYLPDVRRNI